VEPAGSTCRGRIGHKPEAQAKGRLGIDPSATLPGFSGRPQYLLDDREPIAALLA
jgi:hypothetical protein